MIGTITFFSDKNPNPYRAIPSREVNDVFGRDLVTPPLTIYAAIRYATWHGWPFFVERLNKVDWGFFSIVVTGKRKARGDMIGWFTVPKNGDRIVDHGVEPGINPDVHAKITEFIDLVDNLTGQYSGRQIRLALIETITHRWSGVTLRDQGGVYFVPGSFRDRLVNVARKIRRLDFEVLMVDAERTAEGLKSLRQASEADLLKRAKEMREKLAELKRFSADMLLKKAEEINSMFKVADLYESTLDFVLEDLRKELLEARRILEVKLIQARED